MLASVKEAVKYPKVSIIILNWNGLEDTIECLESLKNITYPNYEVIIVDNGSEGNDAQVLKERFSDYVHLMQNDRNYGFAEGNNIGMRYALEKLNPDYILLLNNDTVVQPYFLTELVDVAQNDSNIGILGPKIYYYSKPQTIDFAGGGLLRRIGHSFHIGAHRTDKGQYDRLTEVDFITGCALLIGTGVVDRIGLLDPDYFVYSEDLDWCVRAKDAGYRIIFVPQAKIWHKGTSTLGLMSPAYIYLTTRSRIVFIKKNTSILNFILLFTPFFIAIRIIRPLFLLSIRRKGGAIKALFTGTSDGLFHKWGEPRWRK